MLGDPRPAPRILLLLAVAAAVVVSGVPLTSGSPPGSGVALTLGSDGSLAAGLDTVVANGSALRYAMDGDFTLLVESFPGTNASRSTLLAEINATEALLPGAFGDHDGTVNALDVQRFQSLIKTESSQIPVSSITGLLNVTLDEKAPYSDVLQGASFSSALGPDRSSAPIGVSADLAISFTWSGVGTAHTFRVAWNLPTILGNASLPVPAVNVSFGTPAAVTITSVTGMNGTRISNDPFGWGSASASGQYTPLPGHDVVIQFGPAFPTGDALIIGAIVVAAGIGVGVVVLRRRRRRRVSRLPPPGPSSNGEPGVGPSSGSG